jgi:hypothetical protein
MVWRVLSVWRFGGMAVRWFGGFGALVVRLVWHGWFDGLEVWWFVCLVLCEQIQVNVSRDKQRQTQVKTSKSKQKQANASKCKQV